VSEIFVRRAGWSDWSIYRAHRLEALLDSPEAYDETYPEASKLVDGKWQERVTNDARPLYLAFDGDQLVGSMSGGMNDEYPGTYWLFGLFVTPSARGTNAATMLMEATAQWCREQGGESLNLFVTVSQERAIAFYKKIGFVETGDGRSMHRDESLKLQFMEWTVV